MQKGQLPGWSKGDAGEADLETDAGHNLRDT